MDVFASDRIGLWEDDKLRRVWKRSCCDGVGIWEKYGGCCCGCVWRESKA